MTHFNPDTSRTTHLGSTKIKISRIGSGTNRWALGENDEDVYQAYKALMDRSVNFFDTAEIYTSGRSESLLGACRRRDGRHPVMASKYRPSENRRTEKDFEEALEG